LDQKYPTAARPVRGRSNPGDLIRGGGLRHNLQWILVLLEHLLGFQIVLQDFTSIALFFGRKELRSRSTPPITTPRKLPATTRMNG
jgi:hypothetical protein